MGSEISPGTDGRFRVGGGRAVSPRNRTEEADQCGLVLGGNLKTLPAGSLASGGVTRRSEEKRKWEGNRASDYLCFGVDPSVRCSCVWVSRKFCSEELQLHVMDVGVCPQSSL